MAPKRKADDKDAPSGASGASNTAPDSTPKPKKKKTSEDVDTAPSLPTASVTPSISAEATAWLEQLARDPVREVNSLDALALKVLVTYNDAVGDADDGGAKSKRPSKAKAAAMDAALGKI